MICFRSIRSGSSGNLLLLEHRGRSPGGAPTRLIIDCGIRSQREAWSILEAEVGLGEPISGVLVTHAHSDHINYASLRVLDRLGIPIYAHSRALGEIQRRYLHSGRVPSSVDLSGLEWRGFGDGSTGRGSPPGRNPAAGGLRSPGPGRADAFEIGTLSITPIAVPHAPGVTTHSFLIEEPRSGLRVLVASDFHDPEAVVPYIYDTDLIYLESNHDPELLRRYWNPASRFHLPNPAAGLLLGHAIQSSRRPPCAIVLAHLSAERNRPDLALETVRRALHEAGLRERVELQIAERHRASAAVTLMPRPG